MWCECCSRGLVCFPHAGPPVLVLKLLWNCKKVTQGGETRIELQWAPMGYFLLRKGGQPAKKVQRFITKEDALGPFLIIERLIGFEWNPCLDLWSQGNFESSPVLRCTPGCMSTDWMNECFIFVSGLLHDPSHVESYRHINQQQTKYSSMSTHQHTNKIYPHLRDSI